MEKIYLLRKDKVKLGPFSLEKLKEKQLAPSDLVWYEGLADWTPAGNLEAFNPKLSKPVEKKLSAKFSFAQLIRRLFSKH